MEWLFFQSQSHHPAHVRRKVFVAPSDPNELEDNFFPNQRRKQYEFKVPLFKPRDPRTGTPHTLILEELFSDEIIFNNLEVSDMEHFVCHHDHLSRIRSVL